MNGILFLIMFSLIMFTIFFFARHFWGKDALFVVGIGCAIGSNLYNINNYPIIIGDFVFGMDAVIYTICIFTMLIMYIDFGESSLKNILFSTLGSLFLTALLSFAGNFMLSGITKDLIWNFVSYLFSILGTLVAVCIMIIIYKKLSSLKFNNYFNIAVGLFLASIVNSIIYFGLTFIVLGNLGQEFLMALISSYILKFTAIVICMLAYLLESVWVNSKKNNKKNENKNV